MITNLKEGETKATLTFEAPFSRPTYRLRLRAAIKWPIVVGIFLAGWVAVVIPSIKLALISHSRSRAPSLDIADPASNGGQVYDVRLSSTTNLDGAANLSGTANSVALYSHSTAPTIDRGILTKLSSDLAGRINAIDRPTATMTFGRAWTAPPTCLATATFGEVSIDVLASATETRFSCSSNGVPTACGSIMYECKDVSDYHFDLVFGARPNVNSDVVEVLRFHDDGSGRWTVSAGR